MACAGQLLENWWQGDADSTAHAIDGWAGCGSQQSTPTILLDFDFGQVGKVIDDALPFERLFAAKLGEPLDQLRAQHHGEEGAEDVTTDGGICFVEDRARGEQRLGSFEGVLHGQQIAIAKHDLQSGQFAVGAQHEDAVELGFLFGLVVVDGEVPIADRFDKAAKAGVGDECLVTLRKLAFEADEKLGSGLGILACFLLVARCT